jgi:hypothetical protein
MRHMITRAVPLPECGRVPVTVPLAGGWQATDAQTPPPDTPGRFNPLAPTTFPILVRPQHDDRAVSLRLAALALTDHPTRRAVGSASRARSWRTASSGSSAEFRLGLVPPDC